MCARCRPITDLRGPRPLSITSTNLFPSFLLGLQPVSPLFASTDERAMSLDLGNAKTNVTAEATKRLVQFKKEFFERRFLSAKSRTSSLKGEITDTVSKWRLFQHSKNVNMSSTAYYFSKPSVSQNEIWYKPTQF